MLSWNFTSAHRTGQDTSNTRCHVCYSRAGDIKIERDKVFLSSQPQPALRLLETLYSLLPDVGAIHVVGEDSPTSSFEVDRVFAIPPFAIVYDVHTYKLLTHCGNKTFASSSCLLCRRSVKRNISYTERVVNRHETRRNAITGTAKRTRRLYRYKLNAQQSTITEPTTSTTGSTRGSPSMLRCCLG